MSKRTYFQMTSSAHRARLPETWQPTGRTRTQMNDGDVPRLPHEIDESADAQTSAPRDEMIQAQRDLLAGQLDTDRGQGMNNIYRHVRTRLN